MLRRGVAALLLFVAAGCSDHSIPVTDAPLHASTRAAAREHLAQALARALADSQTRMALKRRLDASNAPEGKLQFQALMHANQSALLTSVARAAATSPQELLADLDASRGLEIYLPVPQHRAAWTGDANVLIGTLGNDHETPVAFALDGTRLLLDSDHPPATPVIALVPQETDFTGGVTSNVLACVDMCGDGQGGGGGSTYTAASNNAPGIYMVQSHFNDLYEGWLKGNPEFEYHVYGIGDNGTSEQLTCASEHSGGGYSFDQNSYDWTGSVMLISDAEYQAYQTRHPGAPIRIEAWEDDDEECVDHADGASITALITAVDKAYNSITSGKSDPWYQRGLKAAPSLFTLVGAVRNIILTNDDFIGNAVEGTITGDAPNGSNWVLKNNGSMTTGWFTTMRR